MPTSIDEAKLKEWRNRLPRRLHLFMNNFFLTCEKYDPEVNYRNYLSDIDLYGQTIPAYRRHSGELVQAFYEITGWTPGRDD